MIFNIKDRYEALKEKMRGNIIYIWYEELIEKTILLG